MHLNITQKGGTNTSWSERITTATTTQTKKSPTAAAKTIEACESDGLVKMDVDPSAPVPEAPPQPNCLIALMVQEGREQTLICWAPKNIDILGKSPDQSYWNTTAWGSYKVWLTAYNLPKIN